MYLTRAQVFLNEVLWLSMRAQRLFVKSSGVRFEAGTFRFLYLYFLCAMSLTKGNCSTSPSKIIWRRGGAILVAIICIATSIELDQVLLLKALSFLLVGYKKEKQ